jgi:hypothetical protein
METLHLAQYRKVLDYVGISAQLLISPLECKRIIDYFYAEFAHSKTIYYQNENWWKSAMKKINVETALQRFFYKTESWPFIQYLESPKKFGVLCTFLSILGDIETIQFTQFDDKEFSLNQFISFFPISELLTQCKDVGYTSFDMVSLEEFLILLYGDKANDRIRRIREVVWRNF